MLKQRLSLTVVALSCLSYCGCSRYEKVSPQAYQYSQALYSACNRHDEPRLSAVADQIETAATSEELTTREADWLNDIVSTAQAGQWQDASQDARALMEAQVQGL